MKNPNHRGDGENKADDNTLQILPTSRTLSENHNSVRKKPNKKHSKQPPKSRHFRDTSSSAGRRQDLPKSPMTSTSAMMSSSSVISNAPSKSKGPKKTAGTPTLPFPDKRGSSKRAHQPSMARMIEVAKKAEARRRAENETSHPPRAKDSETGSKNVTPLQDKNKNGKKAALPGDDVKTAQVLKKAAKAARAKKDPSAKSVALVTDTKNQAQAGFPTKKATSKQAPHRANPSQRRQRWGKSMPKGHNTKLVPADPNRHLTTRQTRELRVEQAMRRLKESPSQERIESLETTSQQRLAQTLNRMSLDNPKSPLLLVAITHPSYTFENPNMNKENNQRLEFLGDAVLDFIVGEYLYLKFPDKSEGELTKIRAAVVNESTLAQAARQIQLGNALLLGRGEQVSGGRQRPSILADALEAVIGAIYLQDGFDAVRQFVLDMLVPIIEEVDQDHYGDFKTLLQEVAQRDDCSICYRILDELGPDHNKSFTAGVFVRGVLKGKGTGRTKKEAEQIAARLTLENWEVK